MPTNADPPEIFVENALIKVPLDSLARNVKNEHKQVTKEIEAVTTTIAELRKRKASAAEASGEISRLVGKLQGLKRKLQSWGEEGEADMERMNVRLQHLRGHENDGDRTSARLAGQMDRQIAEHLARSGLIATAKDLVQHSDLGMLVDMHMMEQAAPIVEAVEKGDLVAAIKWCVANRVRLKRYKSNLEFQLRLQAMIELVRDDALEGAIAYSRKYLGPAAAEGGEETLAVLKRYMAVLAFGKDTQIQPYKHLLELERRHELAELIKAQMWQVSMLPVQSQLAISLQAGLTCLSSTQCLENPQIGSKCPVCRSELSQIAARLPMANRRNSTLVCTSSGATLNEDNPPMALPNGHVYGKALLLDMAAKNWGRVRCPRTGDCYDFSEIRKVYVS